MAGIANPIPKILMKIQGIKYGKNNKFYGIPIIIKRKNSKITLGNNLILNSSFLSNLGGRYARSVIFARDGGEIEIGDNVGMSGIAIYSRKKVKIGNNTLIGINSKIFDNDCHPIDPVQRLKDPNANIDSRPVIIGNNVFIGGNCLILKGSEIGDNTTIGGGSVVSGKIPANCIAAGNPAKVIKTFELNDKGDIK